MKDVLKKFDEQVTKSEDLVDTELSELVVNKSINEEAEAEKSEDENKTEEETEAEKSEDEDKTEDEDKAEKSEEEVEAEKSEDEDKAEKAEEEAEAEKAEDEDKAEKAENSEDEDKAEKSEKAEDEGKAEKHLESMMEIVSKSYDVLSKAVESLTKEITNLKNESNKNISNIEQESVVKSTNVEDEKMTETVKGKAVGFVEKNIDKVDLTSNVEETVEEDSFSMQEVTEVFKSKYEDAMSKTETASDDNYLQNVAKSWGRYVNDNAQEADVNLINEFINKK